MADKQRVKKRFLVLSLYAGFYIGSMMPALAQTPPGNPNVPPPAVQSVQPAPVAQPITVQSPSPVAQPITTSQQNASITAPEPAAPAETLERLRAIQARKLLSGRALWVKRDQLISPERIIHCVDEAADNGYNVLFVQVRGRGDAWYQSQIVPRAELISYTRDPVNSTFDPLAFLLKRAHARGLQVHAWLNAFLVWSGDAGPMLPGHVLNTHPEWVAVDARGRRLSDYSSDEIRRANIEGVFLSPGNPEVRDHLRQVIHEIAANYPVDGIHLDYIRWPLVDTGYDPATRAAFMAEQGIDPWLLRHESAGLEQRFGRDGVASLEQRWRDWRVRQLTDFMADVHGDLIALDRPVILSAAVFPNIKTAPSDVGQDWLAWSRNGSVDMVVPMFYSPKTDVVLKQLAAAQRDMPLDVILYAGIAVYNQPLRSAAEKAVRCRAAGANGISFFPYDTLTERPGSLGWLSRAVFGRPGDPGATVRQVR